LLQRGLDCRRLEHIDATLHMHNFHFWVSDTLQRKFIVSPSPKHGNLLAKVLLVLYVVHNDKGIALKGWVVKPIKNR
jgi:hypothetical protein